jgi:DNA helicase-2/ATP-dependent DNA helicase PcrA
VRSFLDLCETLRSRARKGGVASLVHATLEAVGYRGEVERLYPDPISFDTRWAAVDEVFQLAAQHDRTRKAASLSSFLQELALTATDDQDEDGKKERDAVSLMTLHAAKGLEFPRVYLVGLEEGILPHARSVAEDSLEEERRLMYVGVTRARRNLTLTCTVVRNKYGRQVESMPSRFLYEMKGEPPPESWRGIEQGEREASRSAGRGTQRGGAARKAAPRKKTSRSKAGGRKAARRSGR